MGNSGQNEREGGCIRVYLGVLSLWEVTKVVETPIRALIYAH